VDPPTVKLITPKELRTAIWHAKTNKAPGEDGITTLILRNLPRRAIVLLTLIFNACLLTGYFPKAWKEAKILAFPKPGKPRKYATSYRPISLLSCLSKIFERLIQTRLWEVLDSQHLIPASEFGFVHHKSTTHQLHRVVRTIAESFNMKHVTAMAALDLSKAFDSLQHVPLLLSMINDRIPNYLIHIIHSY